MENEQAKKILMGKILGEIYRLQRRINDMPCKRGDQQIYGLLHGIEEAIEEELNTGWLSNEKLELVAKALDEFDLDPEKKKAFKGFYDIEYGLKAAGLSRGEIYKAVKYLKAGGQFIDLIDRMDSSGSPSECRTFLESEYDV